MPAKRIVALHFEKQILDALFFLALRRRSGPVAAFFQLIALVDQECDVAAIIDHELRAFAARERNRLVGAPPVFREAFTLPREDGHARLRDRGRGVILRREDIAARPTNIRAEIDQRLDQHRGLDRHVQRAGHAHALERLARRVFFTNRHQARHFLLGDRDFLAAPIGQADVGDFVVVGLSFGNCFCAHTVLEKSSGFRVQGSDLRRRRFAATGAFERRRDERPCSIAEISFDSPMSRSKTGLFRKSSLRAM